MLTRWQRFLKPEPVHPCLFVYVTSVLLLALFNRWDSFQQLLTSACAGQASTCWAPLQMALTSRLLTAPSEMAGQLGQCSVPAEVLKSINLLKCFKMYISKECLVGPQMQVRGRCPCSGQDKAWPARMLGEGTAHELQGAGRPNYREASPETNAHQVTGRKVSVN